MESSESRRTELTSQLSVGNMWSKSRSMNRRKITRQALVASLASRATAWTSPPMAGSTSRRWRNTRARKVSRSCPVKSGVVLKVPVFLYPSAPLLHPLDYKTGFGGEYGVQADRVDKSAVGWEHVEKVEKHESQKGKTRYCTDFWCWYRHHHPI